jgi:hypothetical protein
MKVCLTILLLALLVGPVYAKKHRKLPCIPKDQFNAAVNSGASTAPYAPSETASMGEARVTNGPADLARPPQITPRPVCDGKKSARPHQGKRRRVHR